MEALKIKGLYELDEVDLFNYLNKTTTNMIKNRNILTNNIYTDNEYFRDYVAEIKINQKVELTKFKSVIKELNRRIDRGDF